MSKSAYNMIFWESELLCAGFKQGATEDEWNCYARNTRANSPDEQRWVVMRCRKFAPIRLSIDYFEDSCFYSSTLFDYSFHLSCRECTCINKQPSLPPCITLIYVIQFTPSHSAIHFHDQLPNLTASVMHLAWQGLLKRGSRKTHTSAAKKTVNRANFCAFSWAVCLDASLGSQHLPTPLMINAAPREGAFDKDALAFNKDDGKKTVIVHWRKDWRVLRESLGVILYTRRFLTIITVLLKDYHWCRKYYSSL